MIVLLSFILFDMNKINYIINNIEVYLSFYHDCIIFVSLEVNENIYETIKINHFILYFVFVGNCEGYGGTIGVIGYTYGKN